MRSFLAGWGPADVYVNGVLTYQDIAGHFMYTDRARQANGKIYKADKTTPYSPMTPADGFVDPNGRELHVVAHTSDLDPGNFPPNSVWFHLNYRTTNVLQTPAGAAK
ncbi:MAG TPA: hypothetical protein QGH10_20090 [Armatimonadota bacterium]|nr:hypothetical protein [Armatimonadota bacterium]